MRKTVTYTIDEEVLKEFKKCSDQNALNKSKWIVNKMKEYIEENKRSWYYEYNVYSSIFPNT